MWKETYRIGIEPIDSQHIELFRMTDGLIKAIEAGADKAAFQIAVDFLKQYVVFHFNAEEEYQREIGYIGIEEHKKQHRDFTNTVLELEKKLIASSYAMSTVKELVGLLSVWLIYHVADSDQKIAQWKETQNINTNTKKSTVLDIAASAMDALEKMAGLNASNMIKKELLVSQIENDILVEVGLLGDISGQVYFGFSKELAFNLLESMVFLRPEEVDELVCSALAEISNISSGNAATLLSENGVAVDITTPTVTQNEKKESLTEVMAIDTGIGVMTVSVRMMQ